MFFEGVSSESIYLNLLREILKNHSFPCHRWTIPALSSGPQRGNRRPRLSGHPEVPPPPTFRLWPMRQKEFRSGLRPLRHFEEFLRVWPLQYEAPQSTRPWGNLPPLTPFSAGLP